MENRTVRRYYLDWLRIGGVATVFVFHSLHFFDRYAWSVKNEATYFPPGWAMEFLGVWMMPLIFVVSGASLFCASRTCTLGSFLRDKVMRLLVPLVFSVFTFSIGQVYVERVSHGDFTGSLIDFLPHYFEGVYIPGTRGNFAFHGMHLWYLLALFVFTLALVPLIWWSRSASGVRAFGALGRFLSKPFAVLLLVVPTLVVQNLTDAGMLGGDFSLGNWRLPHYAWFLVAGFVIASSDDLGRAVAKSRWLWLAIAIAAIAWSIAEGGPGAHPDVAVWPGLFALMGFAMQRLEFRNGFLDRANEAVLPFYILHQNALLFIGFFVVLWPIADIAKWAVIFVTSLSACIAAYEWVVRRTNPTRIVFGMRPLRRAAA